jgi:hypothetical protein
VKDDRVTGQQVRFAPTPKAPPIQPRTTGCACLPGDPLCSCL